MRGLPRVFASVLLLVAALALAACETAEERAEEHYQRGMALIAEGDVDRAMVEFRNVFRLNGDHTPARLEYARLLVERGETGEAFSQYLRLVEQDWSSVEGHKQLAELALARQDFEALTTHADAAYGLDPEDPQTRALKATADYRGGEREDAVAMARGVLEATPGNVAAHMILIAEQVNAGDPAAALPLIETALGHAPRDEGLHLVKLGVLEQLGDDAGVGAELRAMIELYPDNAGIVQALIRWHLREGDTEAAEELLRAEAAAAPDDPEPQLAVVQFLFELRGPAAARAELDRLIATAADPRPFRRALAGLDAAEGRTEAAVAALTELIEGAEPSDERRDTQVALARLLEVSGDTAGRDALIDAVLAEDPSHVEALKLQARRLIDEDRPDEAIRALRTALNQAPRDADVLTLMAAAHEREGSRELAGERLALAVEVSDRAAEESIRYARFLMQDGRAAPAEAVLADALRLDPANRDLLMTLGRLHLEARDWTRAEEVAAKLRAEGDPAADRMATVLEAGVLRGQDRLDETIAMLGALAGEGGENVQAMTGTVETYLQADNLAGARSYLEGILAREPGNLAARLIEAGLSAVAGDPEAAEAAYRALIEAQPDFPQAHQALIGLLGAQGRADEAEAALDAGIAATGGATEGAPGLLLLKAGLLESRGDFEGAIALYDALYARDSASPVIANNLASLLASHRDDPESLERAFAVARRLRGADVPQFQDTYGWILARRGEDAEALGYLEPAARALRDDPLVQFHLGMTQYRLEQWDAARESLERAIAQAGAASTLPQIATARETLAEIAARAPAGE